MKKFTAVTASAIAGAAMGAGLSLAFAALGERESLPIRDLQIFSEVFGKIKTNYVDPVEDGKLLQDSIRGMLTGLDPHSVYLDAEALRDSRESTTGRFGGLGMEVTLDGGVVTVVAPIDDTPAHQAGIRAGDRIIQLDQTPTRGMTLGEAVERMRGKPGTRIRLLVERDGVARHIVFFLRRAVIRTVTVKSRLLDESYAYVRITRFQTGTTAALRRAINRLKRDTGGALDGVVLDLRNNPGGVLGSAVGVANTFLAAGTIVTTRGRNRSSRQHFDATIPDFIGDAPLVVLVNGGSASASEIVAGALQDHRRAVILGTRTFGKGSVQSIIPVANDAGLKLTTARYFTPAGRSIQDRGIEPNVSTEATAPDGDGEDYQLKEALNLLKGIHHMGRRKRG